MGEDYESNNELALQPGYRISTDVPDLHKRYGWCFASASMLGQATKAFAQMGEMGQHASQQPTTRLGLRNLARDLADAGVIPNDSIQTLGAFVAAELGLSIDACMAF